MHPAYEIIDSAYFLQQYRFFTPAADLAEHVVYYWVLDLRAQRQQPKEAYSEVLMANINSSVVFNLGTPFEMCNKEGIPIHVCHKSVLISYHDTSVVYKHFKNNFLIGIKFKPASLPYLFGIKATAVFERLLTADYLFKNCTQLEALLYEAKGLQAIKQLLDHALRQHVAMVTIDREASYMVRFFEERSLESGRYQLQHIAASLYLTPRTLERYFAHCFDISPKRCLKILRFRKALTEYQRLGYKAPWEDLGYYDFSHFRKDLHHFLPTTIPS
jgi:AraC-like DNA-binding protein